MRRKQWTILPIALVLTLLAVTMTVTVAQDTDPFEGTTIESLGAISPMKLSDNTLNLVRLTMDPGASIAAHHHPGPVVIEVESGEFTTGLLEAAGVINRAARDGQEATAEPIESGVEYVLLPGDSMVYDEDGTGHTMANNGTEPLVLLATVLWTTDSDGFIFEDGAATGHFTNAH
jgi:hypothetical protein